MAILTKNRNTADSARLARLARPAHNHIGQNLVL